MACGRPGQGARGADIAFVLFNGAALAVAVGHLGGWPKVAGRRLPWLVTCEGLSGPAMPAYNTILYASAASAAAGLLTENGSASRRWAALPLLGARSAARMQHRSTSGWWRWRRTAPSGPTADCATGRRRPTRAPQEITEK